MLTDIRNDSGTSHRLQQAGNAVAAECMDECMGGHLSPLSPVLSWKLIQLSSASTLPVTAVLACKASPLGACELRAVGFGTTSELSGVCACVCAFMRTCVHSFGCVCVCVTFLLP